MAITKNIIQSISILLLSVSLCSLSHSACVKSVIQESPTLRFTLHEDTVIDTHTGLQWQRCPLGQIWQAEKKRCGLNREEQRLFTWEEALKSAPKSLLNNHSDWRLPNKNELSSIVDRACSGPAINEEVFPGTPSAEFWTSTPGRREGGYAWRVHFKTGDLINIYMNQQYSVRLVRNQ